MVGAITFGVSVGEGFFAETEASAAESEAMDAFISVAETTEGFAVGLPADSFFSSFGLSVIVGATVTDFWETIAVLGIGDINESLPIFAPFDCSWTGTNAFLSVYALVYPMTKNRSNG